jgi:glycosyltransferase involved in cell wall biosynthesis
MRRWLSGIRIAGRTLYSILLTTRHDRALVAMAFIRHMPRMPRRITSRLLASARPLAALPGLWRVAAPAAAIGLAMSGRTPHASRLLTAVADAREPRSGILAGTAMAIRDFPLAERLAALNGDPAAAVAANPGAALLGARAKMALGHYAEAVPILRAYVEARPGDPYALRVSRRAEGELRVRDPEWLPTITRQPARGSTVRGRIVHLITNSLPDAQAGYTLRAHEIALCQRQVGLDPHMATRAGFPSLVGRVGAPSDELVEDVPYHRLAPDVPSDTPTDLSIQATTDDLVGLVERLRPALLHPASNHLNAQAALPVARALGIPLVYEVRGFLEESWLTRAHANAVATDRYLRTREIETAMMLQADAVVTLSQTMCEEIAGRGVPAERIVVVPNAVDVDRFTPRPPDERLRHRLGLRRGVPVVGYVSSLTEFEGVGYLLQAVSTLRRRGRRVHALVVGEGWHRETLENQAASLHLDDGTAVFTGKVPRDEVADYFALIDVFVVPRTADRVSQLVTPLKPYEAMAMERALVVSDVAALQEIVRDGETGVVFHAEDPIDLADRLEPLLDDPARRAELGRAARDWVAANRTWLQNGERYRALYERLGAA